MLQHCGVYRVGPLSMCLTPAARQLHKQKQLPPRALRRLEQVRSTLGRRPWVVIDGNNVLAAVGKHQSMEHFTLAFDAWAHEENLCDRLITVWDGGGEACAFALSHSAVVFSGDAQLADDVIVQTIGLLRGPASMVTTDNALRGRCYAQRELQVETDVARGRRPETSQPAAQLHELTGLHSIYMDWLMHEGKYERRPVDRSHRREQASALANGFRALGAQALSPSAVDGEERRRLVGLARWLDSPKPRGLSIARQTRHRNILYAYEHSTLEECIALDAEADAS